MQEQKNRVEVRGKNSVIVSLKIKENSNSSTEYSVTFCTRSRPKKGVLCEDLKPICKLSSAKRMLPLSEYYLKLA